MNQPWPILLLTGALGSGKTTVLRHLLNHPDMSGMAVLINEFGEVGLDHQLVEHIDESIVLMRSGCLCCSLRGDLPQTLRHLERRWLAGSIEALKGVVIETTGIADPGPILAMLASNPLVNRTFRLWFVATTVDATFGEGQLGTRPEVIRQVATADALLITKTDLTGARPPAALLKRLQAINPLAATFVALNGVLDVAALFQHSTMGRFAAAWPNNRQMPSCEALGSNEERSHEHETVGSVAFRTYEPIDWGVLQTWLADIVATHGRHLLRLKAILNIAGEAHAMALHGIHETFYPLEVLKPWAGDDHSSRLVMIIDEFEIRSPLITQSALDSRLWQTC